MTTKRRGRPPANQSKPAVHKPSDEIEEVFFTEEAQPEPEAPKPTTPASPYTITKPNDQYVVKNGGNVVYASPSREKCEEYLSLLKR